MRVSPLLFLGYKRRSLRDTAGATAVEYALIAAIVGLGIVGSLVTTRGSLNSAYTSITDGMLQTGIAVPDRSKFWASQGAVTKSVQNYSNNVSVTTYKYASGLNIEFSYAPHSTNVAYTIRSYSTPTTVGGNDVYYATEAMFDAGGGYVDLLSYNQNSNGDLQYITSNNIQNGVIKSVNMETYDSFGRTIKAENDVRQYGEALKQSLDLAGDLAYFRGNP